MRRPKGKVTRIPAEDPEEVRQRDRAYLEEFEHENWAKPKRIHGRTVNTTPESSSGESRPSHRRRRRGGPEPTSSA